MNTVCWLSPDEYGKWDIFVKKHPLGLIYHLSSWQKVLANAFGHIKGQILVLKDSEGNIRAGLPVYIVRSWLLKNRLVSVPFATMCDPLVSSKEEFDLLWPAIVSLFKKHRCHRIEVRTRRVAKQIIPAVLAPGGLYKHHYLPLGQTTDALFRSFHNSCVRRRVEKARKDGIVVEERHDEQSLRDLHGFLVDVRRRHALPPMPFAFFREMYRGLDKDQVSLYLALHEGKPVGGLLALKFKNLWTGEYSGHAEDAPPGADQFLYWETIQRAKAAGAENFSFGRTQLDNEGLLDYKRRWATVEEDLSDFVGTPEGAPATGAETTKGAGLSRYGNALQPLLRYSPAALQKLFGDFCYRHLG